jgi:peptidoglycan hydrolase-like protein with peptidoglycan-binding domain
MNRRSISVVFVFLLFAATSSADELTQGIQKDLVALGYDPGSIQGEATLKTSVAISKFQADNGLEVTGTATPQLAGILSSKVDQLRHGGASAKTSAAARPAAQAGAATSSPPAKAEANKCSPTVAQATAETGKKARALSRLASSLQRLGVGDGQASQAAAEVAAATGAAADAASAANDLTGKSPNGC